MQPDIARAAVLRPEVLPIPYPLTAGFSGHSPRLCLIQSINTHPMEMEDNMAEPVRDDEPLSSTKFPESPSRPGPVPVVAEPADVAGLLPERATDKPLGEWPAETIRDLRVSRFRTTGDAVGNALGVAVHTARQIPEFMQDRASDLRHRFRLIRGRVKSGELQDELKERASEITDEASRQARVARTRAEFYARNYPLQFIAGAAAAGFVIGFLLRIGRDE